MKTTRLLRHKVDVWPVVSSKSCGASDSRSSKSPTHRPVSAASTLSHASPSCRTAHRKTTSAARPVFFFFLYLKTLLYFSRLSKIPKRLSGWILLDNLARLIHWHINLRLSRPFASWMCFAFFHYTFKNSSSPSLFFVSDLT